jgi:hypothetical protein
VSEFVFGTRAPVIQTKEGIPVMRLTLGVSLIGAFLLRAPTASCQQPRATTDTAHRILAQRLVDSFVATHSDLLAMEMAVLTGSTCKVIAATAPEDVGTGCGVDENEPIKTGAPYVETPTAQSPIYDVTQALHDAKGNLIGAIGMDLKPASGQTQEAIVERARELLRSFEAQIPSKARLMGPATPAP